MKGPTPFLWFDSNAEEAANFYVSVIKNSKIVSVSRYGDAGPGPKGQVMVVNFELNGQPFIALNGGPLFVFNESVSFLMTCDTQAEVDEYWSKLTAGGQESMCGWLKDRYGLSWQIAPAEMFELFRDPDPGRAKRAMQAMLQMKGKIDLAAMKRAADQG